MRHAFTMLILLLAALLPLPSAPAAGGSAGGSVAPAPVYGAVTRKDFTIRAYKNTSTSVQMNIYDALTDTLDEVKPGSELNLYPHMTRFLDTKWTNPIGNSSDKVLFSYLVTGNAVGKYELTMTFSAFVSAADPSVCINAQFDILETRNKFKSGVTSVDGCTIDGSSHVVKTGSSEGGPATSSVKLTTGNVDSTIKLTWNVANEGGGLATAEIWTAEGVVVMAIDEAAYLDSKPGIYRSTVTVGLRTIE